MNEFEIQGRTIYKAPHETKHDDGSSSFTLSFPVCEVSEWLQDPEQVLGMLNSYDELSAQLAEKDKEIAELKIKIARISEGDYADLCQAHAEQQAKIERLREALIEAMEWNWVDGDVPEGIVVKCLKVLPERFRDRWKLSDIGKAALQGNADDTNA